MGDIIQDMLTGLLCGGCGILLLVNTRSTEPRYCSKECAPPDMHNKLDDLEIFPMLDKRYVQD